MRSTASFLVILLQIVSGSASDVSTMTTEHAEIDPCTDSTEILSADRRVSETPGSGTKCDSDLNTGWYRFTIGGTPTTIPTSCIKPKACGSELSLRIDLNGAGLPSSGEEIEAWSCGAYDVLGKYDCCVLRQPVRIRNCTSFLAYHLPKPDRCSVSYCVQDIDTPVPHNVLVKTGESVSADEVSLTSPAAETLATTTDTTLSELLKTRCNEGEVYCQRGSEHQCRSKEDCEAIPLSTELVTGEVTTNNYSEADLSTMSNKDLETSSTENSTENSTNVSMNTEAGVKFTTTSGPSTTVTRRLFPPISTELTDDTPPPSTEAEPTALHNDSTTHPIPEAITEPSDNGTADSNTTSGPIAVGETSSAGQDSSSVTAGMVPLTSDSTTKASPVLVNVSESGIISANTSGDNQQDTTTGVSSPASSDGPHVTSHSVSTASSVPTSSSVVTSTVTSSSMETSQSPSSLASTMHSTEPTGPPAGISTPTSTQTSSVTMTTHPTAESTTVRTMESSSASSEPTGWIVLEFTNTKSDMDYSSKVKSSLPEILNAVYKKGNELSHTFSANDIDIMKSVPLTATTAVVLKVTYEESGQMVTIDDDNLVHMFRILKINNSLNDGAFVDKMGTTIVDFYKYGDRPLPTVPPKPKRRSFDLFYDKLPLFIAIIVMATICLLICLFGVVYLKYFRHQRTWDTQKDMERAKLKDNKVHEGLDNPVPDSEIMKGEQTITETSLTVNGSHPPPSVMVDDDKGWVVPIDQAPESLLQVALRTEDTKL